jgi:hypothetical protein
MAMRHRKLSWFGSWRAQTRFDWLFTLMSFVVFVCLEAALLYSYFSWLNQSLR